MNNATTGQKVSTPKTAKSLTAAGIDVRWSKDAWLAAEETLNDFDLMVLKSLVLAARNEVDDDNSFKVMGEHLYNAVRDTFDNLKIKLLKKDESRSNTPTSNLSQSSSQGKKRRGKRGSNKATQGPSKADKIRMQNSLGALNTKIDKAVIGFLTCETEFKRPTLLNDKIVEVRGIGFMCCIWWLLKYRKSLVWNKKMKVLTFSIIVSLERFIKCVRNLRGNSHLDSTRTDIVSETMVHDLEAQLLRLKTAFDFNGESLYRETPQLLIFSSLDDTLPISFVKPYPHQSKICELVKENMSGGFYIMYRAVTNAGKTTTIVSLAATIQKLRDENPDNDNYNKLRVSSLLTKMIGQRNIDFN